MGRKVDATRAKSTMSAAKGKAGGGVALEPSLTGADLLPELRELIQTARHAVARGVNTALVVLYWQIGTRIRTNILSERRAEYGQEILATLSQELMAEFG